MGQCPLSTVQKGEILLAARLELYRPSEHTLSNYSHPSTSPLSYRLQNSYINLQGSHL